MDNKQKPINSGRSTSPLMWLVFAVVVIALGAGGYYLTRDIGVANTNTTDNANISVNTNTTVDTSDWETYENTKYGYSLKYPSNYSDQIWESNIENTATGLLSEWGMNKGQESVFVISVYLAEKDLQKLNVTDLLFEENGLRYLISSTFVDIKPSIQNDIYQGILNSLIFSRPKIN